MKTFDLRLLASAVAATMLAIGAAHAQTSPPTGPGANTGTPGQGQGGGMGKGTETGKGGTMAVPASPNAARSGMWDAGMFSRLDTNKDGHISREEAQADPLMRDNWNKIDAKNAGRVSRSDFEKYGATQKQ